MSLAQAIASYLMSWEGRSALEEPSHKKVLQLIPRASIEEINTEINALTQQSLWNESLITIFHDELEDRLGEETTFVISIIKESEYHIVARVGFEETYSIEEEANYNLTNSSFQNSEIHELIQMFIQGEMNITVNPTLDGFRIQSIHSGEDSIVFEPPTDQSWTLPIQIMEEPDFNFIKRMYVSLQQNDPEIIDLHSDKLIDQLVDYNLALEIDQNSGDTFEGELFLTVEKD